jgi:predicted ATPase
LRLRPLPERWATLRKSTISHGFPKTISIQGNLGLPKQIVLPSPLTLIFGLNGAGKTRALQEISASYANCAVVSMSDLIHYLQHDIAIRSDVMDLIEETDPLSGDKVRAVEVGDLVRRDYDEVQWYVVPIADSPFQPIVGEDIVPIFTVVHAGQPYDFRTMGLGELSAHLLMWLLAYTKDGPSIPMLLDEPEAFMPSPSREVVLSYLLEETIGRSEPIIVASHSWELIQPALDSGSAVYLAEAANIVTAVGPSPELSERVAGLFGRSAPAEWLMLCEDESAFILGDEILRIVAPRLWQGTRFLWCRGYSDLESIWGHLPRPAHMQEDVMNFAFLADGDKAANVAAAIAKHCSASNSSPSRWPFLYLPGDPDVLMKNAAEPNLATLSSAFMTAEASLKGILERLRGREAHNWIEDVLRELSTDRQLALRFLSRAAVKVASEDGSLAEFKDRLHAAGMLTELDQ